MSYDLSNLKRSSSSTEKLTKALEATTKKFQKDERYWELTVDKAGNGFAIIRFLDAPFVDGEDSVPFVQKYSHGFKGQTGWYIENSLTTLGENDPVSEYNSKLWNTGIEANKNIARQQKRQLDYISNILVVKDSMKPQTEGKIFLFRYGAEIMGKVQERLPECQKEGSVVDEDFLLFNPFNYYDGANFKLKARKKDSGFRGYDKSEFTAPSVVGSDEQIVEMCKASHSLKAEVDPTNKKIFKPYAELKARLDRVLGLSTDNSVTPAVASAETAMAAVEAAVASGGDDEDSDELAMFRKLANKND